MWIWLMLWMAWGGTCGVGVQICVGVFLWMGICVVLFCGWKYVWWFCVDGNMFGVFFVDGNMCGGWIHQTGAMQKSSTAANLICDAVTICCINHIYFFLYFSQSTK